MGILIDSLLQNGDTERALEVCQKWQKEMPQENVPYTESALSMARCYYLTHHPMQGDEIVNNLLRRSNEWLTWIETVNPLRRSGSVYTWYSWINTMEQALVVTEQFNRTNIHHQYNHQYELHIKQYQKD
jgi:pentatricopeptide repeat protein